MLRVDLGQSDVNGITGSGLDSSSSDSVVQASSETFCVPIVSPTNRVQCSFWPHSF